MATRALLRRRRFVHEYLNGVSARAVQNVECLGYEQSSQVLGTRGYSSLLGVGSGDTERRKRNGEGVIVTKEELVKFSALGQFRGTFYRSVTSGCGDGRSGYFMRAGVIPTLQSIRYVNTATAGQPDFGSDEERNEEMVAKKRKEASPEECDQAVEGLSSVKAKAKAKRLKDSEKGAASVVLRKLWATILGIGPALRAVAAMSRLIVVCNLLICLF